ncbi:tRNA pseudouridine synthase B [Candidatus Entotheonellaceae bacterium PAL068K]
MPSGILCVDKPRGLTSHDVVAEVRCLAGLRTVGHTGTLDPAASGLLLLCLGRATKFARFFEGLDKTYWTVMRLGVCTDTQDATGRVVSQRPVPALSRRQIQSVLLRFTGRVQQLPPMYSAVKYRGQRLYRLARQGQTVARQPRNVDIRRLDLLDVQGELVTLRIVCSKGTYVRTLCEDIGLALGYGAHTVHLQRCRVGFFCLRQAYTLDDLRQKTQDGTFETTCIPLARGLDFLPALLLTPQQCDALQSGQGRALPTVLATLPPVARQATCYRLHTRSKGTFAVLHRQASTPDTWKVSYLETSVMA